MTIDVDKADLSRVRARIDTAHGAMLLVFFPDTAPETDRSFARLAAKGFYDGLAFHRIVKPMPFSAFDSSIRTCGA